MSRGRDGWSLDEADCGSANGSESPARLRGRGGSRSSTVAPQSTLTGGASSKSEPLPTTMLARDGSNVWQAAARPRDDTARLGKVAVPGFPRSADGVEGYRRQADESPDSLPPTAVGTPRHTEMGQQQLMGPRAGGSTSTPRPPGVWVVRPTQPIETVYAFERQLGKGSFGVVQAARHRETGAEVAVKSISKGLLGAGDVTALRREVEILHHLSGHPHISQLLGVFEEATQLHLVLELYEGGDLFDSIIAVGCHSERAAADVMRTVLTAIAYCHSMGVAHRDIKPENFMLVKPPPPPKQRRARNGKAAKGELDSDVPQIGPQLKLIDFGLSVFCTDDDRPMTETVGTSYYVAPEVLTKSYNRSADVWSAGVILHIMLTGYAPFDGDDDDAIVRAVQTGRLDLSTDPIWQSISGAALDVLTAMLDRNPYRRATADQLLAMPWLGRTADQCTAPSTPLPGLVSDRLRRFARLDSFKKEARRVVAQFMPEEEVAGLLQQFRALDADGDGKLTPAELREGLRRQERRNIPSPEGHVWGAELEHLVERTDLDNDGALDVTEFVGATLPTSVVAGQARSALAAASQTAPSAPQLSARDRSNSRVDPLAAAFAYFDKTGDGYITVDELKAALAAHNRGAGAGPDVRDLMARVDRDLDGRISYPEFLAMLADPTPDGEDVETVGLEASATPGRGAAASFGKQPSRPSSRRGSRSPRSSNIAPREMSQHSVRSPSRSRSSALAWGPSTFNTTGASAAATAADGPRPSPPTCSEHSPSGARAASRRVASRALQSAASANASARVSWDAGVIGMTPPSPPGMLLSPGVAEAVVPQQAQQGPPPRGHSNAQSSTSHLSTLAIPAFSGRASPLEWIDECLNEHAAAQQQLQQQQQQQAQQLQQQRSRPRIAPRVEEEDDEEGEDGVGFGSQDSPGGVQLDADWERDTAICAAAAATAAATAVAAARAAQAAAVLLDRVGNASRRARISAPADMPAGPPPSASIKAGRSGSTSRHQNASLYQAAEAAAMALMSVPRRPDSLVEQMSCDSVASGGRGGGAAAAAATDGTSMPLPRPRALPPPRLLIPAQQSTASRQARRHSVATAEYTQAASSPLSAVQAALVSPRDHDRASLHAEFGYQFRSKRAAASETGQYEHAVLGEEVDLPGSPAPSNRTSATGMRYSGNAAAVAAQQQQQQQLLQQQQQQQQQQQGQLDSPRPRPNQLQPLPYIHQLQQQRQQQHGHGHGHGHDSASASVPIAAAAAAATALTRSICAAGGSPRRMSSVNASASGVPSSAGATAGHASANAAAQGGARWLGASLASSMGRNAVARSSAYEHDGSHSAAARTNTRSAARVALVSEPLMTLPAGSGPSSSSRAAAGRESAAVYTLTSPRAPALAPTPLSFTSAQSEAYSPGKARRGRRSAETNMEVLGSPRGGGAQWERAAGPNGGRDF